MSLAGLESREKMHSETTDAYLGRAALDYQAAIQSAEIRYGRDWVKQAFDNIKWKVGEAQKINQQEHEKVLDTLKSQLEGAQITQEQYNVEANNATVRARKDLRSWIDELFRDEFELYAPDRRGGDDSTVAARSNQAGSRGDLMGNPNP